MHRTNSAKLPPLLRNPKDLNCHGEWFIQNSTSSRMRHKSPALVEFFHSLPPDKGSPSPPFFFFSFFFFFFPSISPSSPPLLELHGARNFAGNSELSRNRCSTKTRKKYRCPRRIVGRSVSSSFSYFFFLFFFTPTTPFRRYLSRRWMEGSLKVEPIVSAMQINTCAQYNSRRGNSKTMYK